MTEKSRFGNGCRALSFEATGSVSCAPEYTERVTLEVTEVLGTAAEAAAGEKFIVRGRYRVTGIVVSLGVVVNGRSNGCYQDLQPGTGAFEVWAEVLEVGSGPSQNHLGLMVGSLQDRECGGVRVRIDLRHPGD
jgi:hypothetical protein